MVTESLKTCFFTVLHNINWPSSLGKGTIIYLHSGSLFRSELSEIWTTRTLIMWVYSRKAFSSLYVLKYLRVVRQPLKNFGMELWEGHKMYYCKTGNFRDRLILRNREAGRFATRNFRESVEIGENLLHANISCFTVLIFYSYSLYSTLTRNKPVVFRNDIISVDKKKT